MPTTFARPELLASPVWVVQNNSRPDVRVVDCRWRVDGSGRRYFAEGHVPGAVYVDWASELAQGDEQRRFELAGPDAVAQALSRAGVDREATVVVCDDMYSLYASRVWWTLRAYGVERARILDGGWPAWLDAGLPISTAAESVAPTTFVPSATTGRRVTAEELAPLVNAGRATIIDARAPADYLGQGGPDPRRGHIRGALNVPAALLSTEGSQAFPPADALSRIFARAGVQPGRPIVTYDATGIGAAKIAFALELMGFDQVAVYDAGWPDWAARPEEEFPVET
ncbi:MAG: sulfurtransferase [Chloroflexota bacterium]|nr:sulfurtransferase [Chloroflexota bacterium]